MSPCLLGIDSGLTVTKAVIFDEEGRERGKGAANNLHLSPHPRWVEQDMDQASSPSIPEPMRSSIIGSGRASWSRR